MTQYNEQVNKQKEFLEMEKKAKQFDKIVCEWKGKVDSLSMDLDITQKECRNVSSELFRIKNAYEESIVQLDEVRKENKSLRLHKKSVVIQLPGPLNRRRVC